MSPNLNDVLANLANKFGTSVEHLFPILVAKEKLEALMGIIFCVILAVACLFASKLLIKKSQLLDDFKIFGYLLIPAALVFTSIACSHIPNYFYPEAAALKTLINK